MDRTCIYEMSWNGLEFEDEIHVHVQTLSFDRLNNQLNVWAAIPRPFTLCQNKVND